MSAQNMKELHYEKPLELFANKNLVKICAPMVRYSKWVNFYFPLSVKLFLSFWENKLCLHINYFIEEYKVIIICIQSLKSITKYWVILIGFALSCTMFWFINALQSINLHLWFDSQQSFIGKVFGCWWGSMTVTSHSHLWLFQIVLSEALRQGIVISQLTKVN